MTFNTKRLDSFFLLMVLVGNISILMIPGLLKVPHFIFTVPLKWGILLYSLWLIWNGVIKKYNIAPYRFFFPLFAFMTVYCFRVVFDLYMVDIKIEYYPSAFDYVESLIYCIIPTISLIFLRDIDLDWVMKWFYILLLLSVIISLFISLNPSTEFVGDNKGRYQGTEGMTSIAYGHQGVTLALLSLCNLNLHKSKISKIIYIGSFFLSLFVIYLAGSRSPFVAIIFCLFFYQIVRNGLSIGLSVIFLFVLPLFLFYEEILSYLSQFGGVFIDRLLYAYQTGESGGRNKLVYNAFEDFLNSPLFGNAFLLQRGFGIGYYPHNLIVESLMATGVIGGVPFITWIGKRLKTAYKLICLKSGYSWVSLIFIQHLIAGMFSFSLFTHDKFWNFSVLVLVAYILETRRSINIAPINS